MNTNELIGYMEYATDISDVKCNRIQEVINCGSVIKVAKNEGVHVSRIYSDISDLKIDAVLHGYDSNNPNSVKLDKGVMLKGRAILRGSNGDTKLTWDKVDISKQQQLEAMKVAVSAITDEIEPFKPIKIDKKVKYREDICASMPLADLHLGLLAWGQECGKDYDMNIAENNIKLSMQDIFSRIPRCKKFVLENLGDFWHRDNQEGYTERGHNPLDTEGRFRKMVRVGIRILCYAIDYALSNHEEVLVINCIGNHDETTITTADEFLRKLYENDKRVTFSDGAAASQYYTFGGNLIGCDHGHKKKFDSLPLLMAAEKPKEWGNATYRVWHTAHYHSEKMKEFAGCRVEAFNAAANRDAYAAGGGWLSDSCLQCVLLDIRGGEYDRVRSYVRLLPEIKVK